MKEFLINFIGMSAAMSAVIVIALLLRRPMKKRFTAISRYVIWSLVLIRLCMPMSVVGLPRLITIPISTHDATVLEADAAEMNTSVEKTEQDMPMTDTDEDVVVNEPMTPYTPTVQQSIAEKTPSDISGIEKERAIDIYGLIFAVWLTAAAGFMITSLMGYALRTRRLNRTLSIAGEETAEIYHGVCREMGIKRIPPLFMSRAATSPMVYGFLKPRIILPDISYEGTNLEDILRHELVHYKRGDLYFKLISLLANSLNWFNPFVYIACDMHSRDMELACDETALGKREISQRLDYGESLLNIIARCKPAHKLTTGFNPKKRAVKERFENIVSTAKRKNGYAIVTVILLLSLFCSCIIGCVNTDKYNSVPQLDDYGKSGDELRNYIYEAKVFPVTVKGGEEDWKLFYEDENLVLANSDGRIFEYGKEDLEYPYRHENIYYSADMTVVDGLGILNYSVPPTEEGYGRNCFVMINTKNGEILNTLSVDALDIVKLHGGNYHDLSPFTSKWCGDYYFESGAVTDKDRYHISVILNTPLGTLVSSTVYEPQTNSFEELYKDSGNSYTLGYYTSDIGYITKLNGASETACNLFSAFIGGSMTPTQAEQYFSSVSYSGYSTLAFGDDCLIHSSEDSSITVDVEVTESGYSVIPSGLHTFKFTDSTVYHSCSDCNGENPYTNEAEEKRQEQGIFHVYTDTWRTESSAWTLIYKDGVLVLSHADGRSYEYAKGSYDHEKCQGAKGYVYGDYGGIVYSTAADEIHFIAVDLRDGTVIFIYEPTVEQILKNHESELYLSDDRSRYQVSGIIYSDGESLVAQSTLEVGHDIYFKTERRYYIATEAIVDGDLILNENNYASDREAEVAE